METEREEHVETQITLRQHMSSPHIALALYAVLAMWTESIKPTFLLSNKY